MEFACYKLLFRDALHIGSNRPGFEHTEEFIRADTLFSALMHAWALLYPDDLNSFFPRNNSRLDFPYFRISSAFPFVGENLFLPKPRWRLGKQKEETLSPKLAKKIKKLAWVEKRIMERWLNDELGPLQPDETFGDDAYWSPGKKNRQTRAQSPLRIEDSPRVQMDRWQNTTTPFTFARLYFREEAGLFFLAEINYPGYQEKFTAALRLLGDEGIGGDRSVGHGHFAVSGPDVFQIDAPENTDYYLILSPFHPNHEAVAQIGDESSYQLITRRGWITAGHGRPLRRQAVRMFAEGSVLQGRQPQGDLVRVLEQNDELGLGHDVFRYGQPLSLPFNPGEIASHA